MSRSKEISKSSSLDISRVRDCCQCDHNIRELYVTAAKQSGRAAEIVDFLTYEYSPQTHNLKFQIDSKER